MSTLSTHPNALRRGYALLVTLVMLALLAVILSGLARRSADTALQANAAEQAMRQRWAERSCAYSLLGTAGDRAERRLEAWRALHESEGAGAAQAHQPIRSESFRLNLSGLTLWGRIDDEQSKINLNQQLATSPEATVSPAMVVDEALRPVRSSGLRLTREPFVQQLGLPRLMSWPQVLPGVHPPELLGLDSADELLEGHRGGAVVERATLWGDGRLNVWTASHEAIRRRLANSVEPETIDTLIQLRDAEPVLGLATLIVNAAADREQDRDELTRTLTERSGCYSLWLAVRPEQLDNAPADWVLMVMESNEADSTDQIREYRW